MARMHEIDYRIHGDVMPFVEIGLDPAKAVVAEAELPMNSRVEGVDDA